MQRVFYLFYEPGEITEIRALGVHGKNKAWEGNAYGAGTISGYYDNPEAFARDAAALDAAAARGIYFTINPCNKALLARAANRLKAGPKSTTQDTDISCIRWLPIDLDCKRPADISSTKEELDAAKETAAQISAWLEKELGFGRAIRIMSGNGYHLYYRLEDLPNDAETHRLIVEALEAIAARFGTGAVNVNLKVVNPARIMKIAGTTARKGDSTEDRPHRKSYLYEGQPEHLAFVPVTDLEHLKALAALAPSKALPAPGGPTPDPTHREGPLPSNINKPAATPFKKNQLGPLKVEEYLQHHGVHFKVKPRGEQTLYVLETCLFNSDHGGGQSAIVVNPNGPLTYQCFHKSCSGHTWKEARKIISGDKSIAEFCAGYDPDWKPPAAGDGILFRDIQVGRLLPDLIDDAGNILLPGPSEIDPLVFYQKKKREEFVPNYMSRYLAVYYSPLVCTQGGFWRYRDGLWEEFPTANLVEAVTKALKEKCQSRMIDNAIRILQGLVNKPEEDWIEDPLLLNCKNGMLHVETRELLPHDPKYNSRVKLPVSYDPEARAPRWMDFLTEIFPEDYGPGAAQEGPMKHLLLKQFFGYTLLRDCRFHKCLFMYGVGANGKSTTINVLTAMLGTKNVSTLTLHNLAERFNPQYLYNKLANVTTETNARDPLATEILKAAIAGDEINAEKKYGESFKFKPFAKFMVSFNTVPTIPDKSHGLGRRLIIMTFTRRFAEREQDRLLTEKLIEEINGLFRWSVDGLSMLLKDGGFVSSRAIERDKRALLMMMNPMLVFIEECCELGKEQRVLSVTLWDAYRDWCKDGNYKAMSRNNFFETILTTFPDVKKVEDENRHQTFFGISVRGKTV